MSIADITDSTTLCIIGGFVVLGLLLLANSIRIVPENKRLEVNLLGQEAGIRGPGIVVLIPIIERGRMINFVED